MGWTAACSEGTLSVTDDDRSPPDIVLVTLDTVRADALGYAGGPATTPIFDSLADEGLNFTHAYTTAPTTLPAHVSMFSGLYPAAHGIHENGRRLHPDILVLAEAVEGLGYSTAAFVSGYPLARRFGLARGFDHYDDDLGDDVERTAAKTTDRVLAFVRANGDRPRFLWVHYYDAHDPYEAPEPFASRWGERPYYGEIEYLDRELGRLLEAVRSELNDAVLIVAGDHGEGLGDHGEERHGNLLYQEVMRVPLLIVEQGAESTTVDTPVSIRRVFHTILGLAGGDASGSLLAAPEEAVLAEAMKPYLQYGWQPQVMAVEGSLKAIRSGNDTEIYDLATDPEERRNLAEQRRPTPAIVEALRTYPLPSAAGGETEALTDEERRNLAALGYVSSTSRPELRPDAPHARHRTALFDDLDRGSVLFVEERWDEAIDVFEDLARRDPENLMVQLRLAVAHSLSGRRQEADESFQAAERIAPESVDRKRYLGLHHCRFGDWPEAEAVLDGVPDLHGSVPALQCLGEARLHRGAFAEAAELLATAVELQPDSGAAHSRLGDAHMAQGATAEAIKAYEQARQLDPTGFDRRLELGVLYLSDRRLDAAIRELDAVPADHPAYPMAIFKRAQASVLLGEADSEERVRAAWRHADATTRPLIAKEELFRGVSRDGR